MIAVDSGQMRDVDRLAAEDGFPELLLMEAAGRGVAEKARKLLQEQSFPAEEIIIITGSGNNGGDGLVAARFLEQWGYQVRVLLLKESSQLEGNVALNYQLCKLREISIQTIADLKEGELSSAITGADLLIDAMLGTGLKGRVREREARIIKLINRSKTKVLAVDLPSGLDADNGKILGSAVRADYTVSMAYPKVGLYLYPGREYTGRLEILDIGIPRRTIQRIKPHYYLLNQQEAAALLPVREVTGHKGTFGKVGVVGGSVGMAGAPALTGLAALKTGAGLVRTAVPIPVQNTVAGFAAELITEGLSADNGQITEDSLEDIIKLAAGSDVLAVGPGLGVSRGITRIINRIITEYRHPLVLDADGINALTERDILLEREAPLILTPHPGEMARLLRKEIAEVEQNRVQITRQFAISYGVYLILKGAGTVIGLPDGRVYINTSGNHGLGTAGSGDVLTGIISGLLAQGLTAERAVVLGPYLHGLAGDLAVKELSAYSLTAGDIISYISQAFKSLEKF